MLTLRSCKYLYMCIYTQRNKIPLKQKLRIQYTYAWPATCLIISTGPCREIENSRGGCDQICTPRGETAMCHCDVGFTMNADGKTCDTSKTNTPFQWRLNTRTLIILQKNPCHTILTVIFQSKNPYIGNAN